MLLLVYRLQVDIGSHVAAMDDPAREEDVSHAILDVQEKLVIIP